MLEEEFGGIIETDCVSVRDCLNLLSWHDYSVGGYIIDKSSTSVLGVNVYQITVSDDKSYSYEGNTISIGITENAFSKVEVGNFIYAKGEHLHSYTATKQMSCSGDGLYISHTEIEGSISISEYIEEIKEIFEETYFKTEGLVIQNGTDYEGNPRYYLYPSEKAYKENKSTRVELTFSEKQQNLAGKHVTIIGKPDEEATYQGLKECSIID